VQPGIKTAFPDAVLPIPGAMQICYSAQNANIHILGLQRLEKSKPRAQYQYLPITPSLCAMYSSPESAQELCYCSKRLKEALKHSKVGFPGRKFSDHLSHPDTQAS
jgi:hypothetical protein